jgi:hypothetical protein
MKFKKGQRVRLKADPVEGFPEEVGTVDGPDGNGTYVVTVDSQYRIGKFDDGLREVTPDQMVAVIR